MALQSSGQLSFGNISNEFGLSTDKNLGAYRISETYGGLSNLALDTGIPQSGTIKFSDFYNKRLNVIVNFFSGPTESRVNAKSRYTSSTDGSVFIVGGFTEKPDSTDGKKIIVHVNKRIGSIKDSPSSTTTTGLGDTTVCAFRTGTWDSGTTLQLDVGPSGIILGAGGDGGAGADYEKRPGFPGRNGNSAIGIQYSSTKINLYSGSYISCGFGGGGGGGAAYDTDKYDDELASGGGGGGGAGSPPGLGGAKGDSWEADGTAGSNATLYFAGAGGPGGDQGEAKGGAGGRGGDRLGIAQTGAPGRGEKDSNGGNPGLDGAAIRISSSGIVYTIGFNSGSKYGSRSVNDFTVS